MGVITNGHGPVKNGLLIGVGRCKLGRFNDLKTQSYCLMEIFFHSKEESSGDRRAQWGVCCQGDKLSPVGAWGQMGLLAALYFLLLIAV